MKAIRRPEIPPTIIATTANPGIFPKTRKPIVVADGPFPIPLPPPVDDIIGAIKRFEVEAKKEKKEMKQKVESMEEKYKRLMDDFDKYESFETKLDNLDLNMRSENKKVRGEFRKRDKSLFYMVSKKFLPYIRSLISRMDVIDEKLKKMEELDYHYGAGDIDEHEDLLKTMMMQEKEPRNREHLEQKMFGSHKHDKLMKEVTEQEEEQVEEQVEEPLEQETVLQSDSVEQEILEQALLQQEQEQKDEEDEDDDEDEDEDDEDEYDDEDGDEEEDEDEDEDEDEK